MADIQARCLYDFDGDVHNGELSFTAGEPIVIMRQDIGDGWWEARNNQGETGLVPETYVEVESVPEPQFPPPPPPMVPEPASAPPPSAPPSNHTGGSQGDLYNQQSFEDWDEDWGDDYDEEDDQSSNSTLGHGQAPSSQDLQGQGNLGLSAPKREKKQLSPTGDMSKYGTVKSSFSRFSHFAKSGGESFLLGQVNDRVPESDKLKIVETADGPEWLKQESACYTCAVTSPKKESKMKGLKSFMVYQLTPSFTNIVVSRRYKHFDWLHERLEVKFVCIPIPPLPDKAVTGRYDDDFVQERMRQLQMWINRMVRHPVICRSDVFHHFLTCTDEKKWKVGKRKAEKDEFQGGKFFQLLQPPTQALDVRDVENKMEAFCKFVLNMTDNIKTLIAVHHDWAKKQNGPIKKEYTKIGASYKQMAQTFNLDTGAYSRQLTAAIDHSGDCFNEIGEMFSKQPPKDSYPLLESFYEYKGILQTFPDVLKVHEGAIGKAKDCQKSHQEEGKLTQDEVHAVLARADTISYGTLAEVNNFQRDRVHDFKVMMQTYLKEQIAFHKAVTAKLETALQHYDTA